MQATKQSVERALEHVESVVQDRDPDNQYIVMALCLVGQALLQVAHAVDRAGASNAR